MSAPVIIVFGITGDLSKRKLLPALYHLLNQGALPADTKIIGISRRPLTTEQLLSTVELCVLEKDNVCDPKGLELVRKALHTLQLDPEKSGDYDKLASLLHDFDAGTGPRQKLFYMSIPASAYKPIVTNLARHGLNDKGSRLLLEKPFGYDVASAQQLLDLIGEKFSEEQVYRIDHYLAKETAQNLLMFRMHNPIFAPLWNAEHVQAVHIRAFETIGIEGRGSFYEQTGALRDLIQSHLLQLLAITLMDLPSDLSSPAIHHSKEVFLEQIQPADPALAARGQYRGYQQEVDNPGSFVETYARLRLTHQAERWQGTEITLETGKALAKKTTDVTIEFKTPHERRHNNLTFRIQPNEGIGLDLLVKEPGYENRMRHAALDFRYSTTFEAAHVEAYERVLLDAVRGDQALFASSREVLATWRILQPVLDTWQASGDGLIEYAAGAGHPEES